MSPAPPEPSGEVERRRPFLVVAGVLALLASGLAAFLFWPKDSSQPGDDDTSADPLTVERISALALGDDNEVYVVDYAEHQVLKVDDDGKVSPFAGSGTAGNTGNGGSATEAGLEFPSSVAWHDATLWIATGGIVREVNPDGIIGPGPDLPAGFGALSLAVSEDGTLYAADKDTVLRLDPAGRARVLAEFASPSHIEDLAVHPDGWLAVTDSGAGRIVKVDGAGDVSPLVGPGTERTDLIAASDVEVNATGVAFDAEGLLYFSDAGANRVRMIRDDGKVLTVAGSPDGRTEGDSGDGGPGREATFNLFVGPLAIAADGTVYIGDAGNHRVRTLDPDGIVHAFG